MTTDENAARNRANAMNSTGPKSARGKAVVAGNARRHGATARPDPDSVATWLAIILDRPDITPGDLLPEDEQGYRALFLAQAEARLVAAEHALRQMERDQAKQRITTMHVREIGDVLWIDAVRSGDPKRKLHTLERLLAMIGRISADENGPGGERHRLLRRYVREARAQRRRAFEAWAAVGRDGALAA